MEERSSKAVHESQQVHPDERSGRTSADQIISGTRAYPPGYGQRQARMTPGTYVVNCDLCRGSGLLPYGLLPYESCLKCDGAGSLIVNGERSGDAEKRTKFRDFLLFVGVVAILATFWAIACAVLIARAKAW